MARHRPTRGHGNHYTPNRKDLQLAKQIQETIHWVLGSVPADDVLLQCTVGDVTPAPGSNQMVVKILVPSDFNLNDVLTRLHNASKELRLEVAESINRRKVPDLVFVPTYEAARMV